MVSTGSTDGTGRPTGQVDRRDRSTDGTGRPTGQVDRRCSSLLLPDAVLDLALPGDRVEVLAGAEADRDQLAVVGHEVDQAHRRALAAGERGRQPRARARRVLGPERRRLEQGVALVEQVERDRPVREVAPAEVAHRRAHEVRRRLLVAASRSQSENALIGILTSRVTVTAITPTVFWSGFQLTRAVSPTRSCDPWADRRTPATTVVEGLGLPVGLDEPPDEDDDVLPGPPAVGVDEPDPPPHPASTRATTAASAGRPRRRVTWSAPQQPSSRSAK